MEGAANLLNLARQVVKINLEALQDTLTLLDEGTLLRAVNTILGAKHVFLIGFGTSAPVIQDAARVAQFVVIDIICATIGLRKESELVQSTERITAEVSGNGFASA